ncbi:MAG TPA: hypothetical protein VK558_15485, partial [Patescibacteria group bacterium]|nr:hypothetical protein [Patescibacteria group bacterium]
KATGWVLSRENGQAAQTIYHRYVKQGALVPWATHFGHDCPEPDFDAGYGTMRRQAVATVHHVGRMLLWPVLGLGLAVGLAVAWRVRTRRRLS